ncbi:TRAP transporter large permease subunit [Vibrio aquaticus]|uniref:TRAP transporter large permease protein n=1 Tax=Vibrio aquaticus TaxID=2496559 RepID=A0A3S0V4Q5_9VIBR|nr:TRAP transporter large permease subunit [Vibrio aquaticus]RTZ17794.1 TRAP transporter large permease subunit [Vibrio aquaticus]
MSPLEIGVATLLAMVVLVYSGFYVSIALMLCSYIGVWAIKGTPTLAGKLLAISAYDSISTYHFGVIPLFVLMGLLIAASGIGRDAFDVANLLFKRVKGGLGVGAIGANTLFAAITGISIASASIFTKIAVPELTKHGYSKSFATGIVAGSSVLGMLIPPSLLLILYGFLADQSVGDLFLAGVVPGLLLAILFCFGVVVITVMFPRFAGQPISIETQSDIGLRVLLAKIVPILGLIVVVLGGLYLGLFTPIEAGAIGCLGAFIVGLIKKALSWKVCLSVLNETGLITASIGFLIIAAQMYSRMLSMSGLPAEFGEWIGQADIGFWGVILAYVAAVILMGTLLDSSSIMLVLLPLILPIVIELDVNLIWFGIVTVLAVEIGLLTPPFGLSVYVIKSTLNDSSVSTSDIFAGAAPFALIMLITLGIIIAFPNLTTMLL